MPFIKLQWLKTQLGSVCIRCQETSASHGLSFETTATSQCQQGEQSFKCDCNRLDLFNGASERVAGSGSGIKVAPWLCLQETAEQKASLNKRTRRYLTPFEGGSESNRQGEVSEYTQVGLWFLFMVHTRQKGPTQHKSKKSSKLQMHANLSNFLLR